MTTAVVCAAFDAPSDDRIERLRRLVEGEGLRVRRAHRPHLTLSGARVASSASVGRVVEEVARRHGPIRLAATGLGSFPSGVLYVEVAASESLDALQRDAHATLASTWPPAFGAQSEPDTWVAHCTLATRVSPPALQRLTAAGFDPFPLVVDALAVLEVGGTGDVAHLPLGGP